VTSTERIPRDFLGEGALTVLCAWAIFVVAGIGLQRLSEHWQDAVSKAPAHTWATISFGAVQVLAVIASLLVVVGAIAVLPAAARFLRAGGWPDVRGQMARAAVMCGITVIALAGLAGWAHQLTPAERDGVDGAYGWAVLLFSLLVVASIATLTVAAVSIVRRLHLSPQILHLEGRLAEAVTVAMVLMAIAACVWWGVTAAAAPSFFGGPSEMAVVAGLMVIAVVVAVLGTRRVLAGARN
jgi:hypothetical protein